MDLFRLKCVIISLILLAQKLSSAHVTSSTNGQTVCPIEGSINFVKPPWLDLEILRSNERESQCREDIATVYKYVEFGEEWALRMLDASSKVPSGILTGNIVDLGAYDECIGVNGRDNPANVQGRHCMISFSISTKFVKDAQAVLDVQKLSVYNPNPGEKLSLTLSACLPSTCDVKDVIELANASVRTRPELTAFEAGVENVTCSRVEHAHGYSLGRVLTLSLFAMMGALLLFCTACDFVVRTKSPDESTALSSFSKFSLYRNACKLLNTEVTAGTMPALNGIRVLCTFSVVIAHRFLINIIRPATNVSYIYEFMATPMGAISFSMPRVIDTFLVLSGFLTAHALLKVLRSGKKVNLSMLYVHRYFRFTPCMIIFLLFTIFVLPDLGSGPIWEILVNPLQDSCKKNWWTNLLYLNNMINNQEMCISHTWYLAAEMHFFLICPIILYPLYRRPKLGLVFLGLLLIASMIVPAVQLGTYQWAAFFHRLNSNLQISKTQFFKSYTISYNRATPYLVGILLGYDVVNNRRQVTPARVVVNWILTGLVFSFCVWSTYFVQPVADTFNVAWEVAYVSVLRLGWSIGVAWILYACTQGYGGSLTRFLSLPLFVPLSRLCYCIYWIHPYIMVWTIATLRTPVYISPLSVGLQSMGDLVICSAVGFVLTLCIETPIILLEKRFMTKQRSLIEVINQVEKDSTVEENDSSSDSARLEIAVAKWAEIWREWKLNESKIGTRFDTRWNIVNRDYAESDAEITSLEKEFLIFLTAMSRDSGYDASFRELRILESARSQLHRSLSLQDKDATQLPRSESLSVTKKTI